ncbi:MAG: putative signal transducing protein [Victivallaceae bacterium]
MKQIFTDHNLIKVLLCKMYLENEGIETAVMNECSAATMPQVLPELWIIRDEDYDLAVKIVERVAI